MLVRFNQHKSTNNIVLAFCFNFIIITCLVELGNPDPDAPKDDKDKKKDDDIGNMWEKYWNMDPENYIWGIDPNEKPPPVK